LKNLHDSFPEVKIRFSGSSTLALQTGKADLSRRVVFHDLPGLSFREYLQFAHGMTFDSVQLPELLENHTTIATEVLRHRPVLGNFAAYLDHGVYPFFLEGVAEYHQKLRNIIERTLYEDIPTVTNIRPGSIPVLKRILWLISTSQPFVPNIDRMARDLSISKQYVYEYLDSLQRAGLIAGFPAAKSGYRLVRKPAKIFIENTNLLKAIVGELKGNEHTGTLRETFFVHQLKHAGRAVTIPHAGDVLIDDRFVFEIGGMGKGRRQLGVGQDAYVVRDDIDLGSGRTVPLWLFGFLC
jgi:predicted AAA+ superfamily ATPase